MTAQEAKAKVLDIWPEAQESFFGDQYSDGIEIWSDRYSEGGEEIGGGRRMTSDEAWIDAASRLPVEPKAQVGSASVEKNNPVLDAEPKSGVRLNKPSEAKATLMTEGRTGTANVPTGTKIEPKEVESASVGAISDHEKGQKEEFYKFQQHLEKTQEEISKWPSWMREAGRASMGLDQREPKEVEAGEGLIDLKDYESMYANAVGELKTEQEAHQASLLREKELRELLRETGSYIAGVGRETYGDILLERIKAAVTGE